MYFKDSLLQCWVVRYYRLILKGTRKWVTCQEFEGINEDGDTFNCVLTTCLNYHAHVERILTCMKNLKIF